MGFNNNEQQNLPGDDNSISSKNNSLLLICEDEPMIRGMLTELLEKDYQILIGKNGDEVVNLFFQQYQDELSQNPNLDLAAFIQEKVQGLLSDLTMEGMDGVDLITLFRAFETGEMKLETLINHPDFKQAVLANNPDIDSANYETIVKTLITEGKVSLQEIITKSNVLKTILKARTEIIDQVANQIPDFVTKHPAGLKPITAITGADLDDTLDRSPRTHELIFQVLMKPCPLDQFRRAVNGEIIDQKKEDEERSKQLEKEDEERKKKLEQR